MYPKSSSRDMQSNAYAAGRWRGTLVAIKMVEHAAGASAVEQAEKIEREALLSTSLSHPNIITTFKVCTMLASTAQALRSTSSADTDWSAPTMPRNPGSPQQPGSVSEDGASSHRSYMDSASTVHGGSIADFGPGSAQATPRDSAMSEHGGGGMRMLPSPFSLTNADRPAHGPHGSSSSASERDSLAGTRPSGDGSAAATAVKPAFDSAAIYAGRRPPVNRAEEGDYALSPEELAAEDDPDAVEERCGVSRSPMQECLPVGNQHVHTRHCWFVKMCKSLKRSFSLHRS